MVPLESAPIFSAADTSNFSYQRKGGPDNLISLLAVDIKLLISLFFF